MKSLHLKGGALLYIAVLLILLSGCIDEDRDTIKPVPVGYVSIYHASPDAPSLDVVVDNNRINSRPISYTDYSGYLNFYTGSREVKFNATGAANALADTTLTIEDGNAYSIFVINRLSHLEALVTRDSAATLSDGKAMIRFVQLSPDARALEFKIKNENDSTAFSKIGFKTATGFKEVNAGNQSLSVKNEEGESIAVANGVAIRPGGYYTIIARGFLNPPTGNANVFSLEVVNN